MGLNECELKASTSPLRRDDTKFPATPCAKELISLCLIFFIYVLAKI